MKLRRAAVATLIVLLSFVMPSVAFAGSIGLDPGFSVDGKRQLDDVGPRGANVVQVLATVAGNTYALGTLNRSNNQTGWYLARFLPDGSPDPTFGDGGVTLPALSGMGGLTPYSFDLFVSDDGSAVVSYQNFHELVIMRYTTTGTLNKGFSADGIRHLPVESNHHFSLSTSITIDNQDRVVVAGTRTFLDSHGYASDMLLFRLLSSGGLDSDFSQDGRRVFDNFRRERPIDVTTDASGRVLLSGYHQSPYHAQRGAGFFYRFTPVGSLDPSFSNDGSVSLTYQGWPAYPGEVTVGADGDITSSIVTNGGAVGGLRLEDNGSRVKNYGDNGVAAILCSCDRIHAAVDDGRVILTTERTGHPHIHIATVSRSGSVIRRYSGVLVPKTKNPYALDAIAVEGDRIMVGARWNGPAYLARVALID